MVCVCVCVCKISLVQFSSVAQPCLTHCDPMDCSTAGFPVHHQLLELTQTNVHQADDAIQPSHPLSSPGKIEIFPSVRVFSNESVLHIRWPNYWSFSFSITPSNEYFGNEYLPMNIFGKWYYILKLYSESISPKY